MILGSSWTHRCREAADTYIFLLVQSLLRHYPDQTLAAPAFSFICPISLHSLYYLKPAYVKSTTLKTAERHKKKLGGSD